MKNYDRLHKVEMNNERQESRGMAFITKKLVSRGAKIHHEKLPNRPPRLGSTIKNYDTGYIRWK
jgi:hypothetical protein